MSAYVVDVYDCAGRFSQTTATDFPHTLSIVRLLAVQYPGKRVCAFNLDQIDAGFDGLTDDERDSVDEVIAGIDEARKAVSP